MRSPRLAPLVLLVSVLLLPGLTASPSSADPSSATAASPTVEEGEVVGEIRGPGAGAPQVRLTWFSEGFAKQLGTTKETRGSYSLALPPGKYVLQFTDLRPAYDVKRFQPTDMSVEVEANSTTVRTVTMEAGAAIGGVVQTGGRRARVAPGARIVVALKDERSFETRADDRGRYALGGLPDGKGYSVFTYDRKAAWVSRSIYLRKLAAGEYKAVSPRLGTRAGALRVTLRTEDGRYDGSVVYVTAVSQTTGQFWTRPAVDGSVVFSGLFPGRYRLLVPGLDDFLPAEVTPAARVRPGRTAFTDARLTQRGATITGTVVDRNNPAVGLPNARVRLVDAGGQVLANAVSGVGGAFTIGGQLTTQSGLTIVAGPDPAAPFLGQGTQSNCAYGDITTTPFSVLTGQVTTLEDVLLPHLPDVQQPGPQCYTPAPTPRETP